MVDNESLCLCARGIS